MKSELKRFGRGFVYAYNGIRLAIREERNIRFHLCAAAYAYLAAVLAGLGASEFALLSLAIFCVIQAELMNSAVERAVDKPDTTHWWSAGAAKDMAAGAVLMSAVGALFAGGFLFLKPDRLMRLWSALTANPLYLILLAISLILAYLFVFRFGGAPKKEGLPDDNKQA
ncbi:diacylglycerol kinase family protein [uncultured Gemmiger sp.]|uniref:diacylglycerol kinase family protein n=1 Tax=uncultured Gemmiger sp. TaxID=1623490 RepID=UPI0025ED2A5C|nr:diacylglycerol kinase family protein [uncultured Gemmiger sp.]